MFETFDHTADLGLRVRAADLNTLFAEAGRGLTSIIVEKLDDLHLVNDIPINIDEADTDYLFFDWLNVLLFHFNSEQWLFKEFSVEVNDSGLAATARGEQVSQEQHRLSHEVKAITYHQLKVEQTVDGWLAEVIVDI